MTSTPQDTMQRYLAAWNTMDFTALEALWDAGEDPVYYVAEEVDRPLHRFSDVQAYWQRTAATIESVKIEISDLRFKALTDDLCVVTYEMHVDASMQGYAAQGFKPVGSDVRVSAILKQREAQWRFIHYSEAALGALPFIRRVYNANVRGA